MGDPDQLLLALWRQRDQQERNVMHPVNAVDKQPDHRVIELIEHLEEPLTARSGRQAAEHVAQRLGIGGSGNSQRPDAAAPGCRRPCLHDRAHARAKVTSDGTKAA